MKKRLLLVAIVGVLSSLLFQSMMLADDPPVWTDPAIGGTLMTGGNTVTLDDPPVW